MLRTLFGLPFLGIFLFCIYGFLSSFELANSIERLPWQGIYGIIGLLSILTFLFILKPKNNDRLLIPMKTTLFIHTFFLVFLCSIFGKKPNILFIMSDDHAAHAISAYGGRLANIAPDPKSGSISKRRSPF